MRSMTYISTRGGDAPVNFQTAILAGLARDGGLYLPATIPDVSKLLAGWHSLKYQELAFQIMRLFADLPESELRLILHKAYAMFDHTEITPVTRLEHDLFLLELFHGPTLAFKDLALQFLGGLFEYYLGRLERELNIVVATSGDTGSAAIYGVKGRARVRIFVLYPYQRVSPSQELQMVTVPDANVFTMALRGTFDDCQHIVKTLLSDLDFRDRYSLGAVNSINWARILAQIVYYFYAAFRVMEQTGKPAVSFAVPTGNFGDIFAGYIAWRMGLPIQQLVLATNENNILANFFHTGLYQRGEVHTTISPSMDIQVASNFERYLYYKLGADAQQLREMMLAFHQTGKLQLKLGADGVVDPLFCAGSADTAGTLAEISNAYALYKQVLDPHTAAGLHVARQCRRSDVPMVCLATAHPAKFSAAIRQALEREDLTRHPALDGLAKLPIRRNIASADAATARAFIERHVPRDI